MKRFDDSLFKIKQKNHNIGLGLTLCSRQRQEVTCYLCCRGHVIMFTSPDTSSALITTNLFVCVFIVCVSTSSPEIFVLVCSCLCPVLEAPPPRSLSESVEDPLLCSHFHLSLVFRDFIPGGQEDKLRRLLLRSSVLV